MQCLSGVWPGNDRDQLNETRGIRSQRNLRPDSDSPVGWSRVRTRAEQRTPQQQQKQQRCMRNVCTWKQIVRPQANTHTHSRPRLRTQVEHACTWQDTPIDEDDPSKGRIMIRAGFHCGPVGAPLP